MNSILFFVVILLLLLKVNFFYIIPFPESVQEFNSDHQNIFLILIIYTCIFIFLTFIFRKNKYPFYKEISLLLILSLVVFLNSMRLHNQSFMDVLISGNYIFLIGAYFIFTYILSNRKNYLKFEEILMVINVILSSLFIIQFFMLSYGIQFLNINLDRSRFGNYRIYQSGDYINFVVVLSLGVIFRDNIFLSKKTRNLAIVSFALGFFYILFVSKTRMVIILILLSLIVMGIIKWKKNLVRIFSGLVCSIVILYFFSLTPIAQEYLKSFQVYDASVSARERAITLYWNQFLEHPILGMGFIRGAEEGTNLFTLLRGISGNLTRTDVGFIGYINTIGIFGAILYILLFYKIGKVIYELNKNKLLNFHIELLGIFTFYLFSSLTLIVMDPQRILYFTIFLSMLSSIVNINSGNNERS